MRTRVFNGNIVTDMKRLFLFLIMICCCVCSSLPFRTIIPFSGPSTPISAKRNRRICAEEETTTMLEPNTPAYFVSKGMFFSLDALPRLSHDVRQLVFKHGINLHIRKMNEMNSGDQIIKAHQYNQIRSMALDIIEGALDVAFELEWDRLFGPSHQLLEFPVVYTGPIIMMSSIEDYVDINGDSTEWYS